MSFLKTITPSNLREEKEKFLTDHSYNPQFIYSEPFDQDRLAQYGTPQAEYAQLAEKILKQSFAQYSEQELEESGGVPLTQGEVEHKIHTFLKMHGLEQRYELSWSGTYISRTSISTDTINLRLPVEFRQESLLGMLYHEIGTHALRQINYEQQPWYKKKKKHGFSEYLYTEEGLAALHGLLPHTVKLAYKQARLYLGVAYAQQHSFSETWAFFHPYITDLDKRWTIIARLKRGLTDTSQPGGYTKDLAYFKGLVDTWRWLAQNDFNCTQLYYGKIATDDIPKALEQNPGFKPLLPSFFTTDQKKYTDEMREVGSKNYLNLHD
jgi:hypothetical protein